ncbi:hypothetical protein IIA16_03135, partial [bacterium]|nr:hypothetical protein [bacterium]
DFAQYLPIGLDIAWPAAIDCLSPPTATVDVDARIGELDTDANGLLDPSADLGPEGIVAPLTGGALSSPPDGTPPDLDALWNLSGGGFAWTPLPGLCTAALWGFSPTVVDVVVVTVTTATVDTVYEISGDFVSGLIFPGAAGDGWIRTVAVAFPDGGAAIWAFAATACP